MRWIAWTAVAALWAAPVMADQTDPRLEPLFEKLGDAADPQTAVPIESQIWSIWSETGDTEDARLYASGVAAMERRAFPEAVDAFSTLVARSPDFAEAWNKRATVYYAIGDYDASVADIRRVLTLEPRHFGALSGLGLIYVAIGEPSAAVRSFEAALQISPQLAGARAHVDMLKGEAEGDPT